MCCTLGLTYAVPLVCVFAVYLRKLSDEERPLHLRLCAGPSEKVLSLVLKENETGDVNVSEDRRAKRILIHEACRRQDA